MVRIDQAVGRAFLGWMEAAPDESRQAFERALMGQRGPSIDDLARYLTDQLYTEEPLDEGNLVDIIADIIQTDHGRSVLSGDGLRALRDAILLPSERARFLSELRSSLCCTGCGRKFSQWEMATITGSGAETSIQCVRCAKPQVVACGTRKCSKVVAITQTFLRWLNKNSPCEEHSGEKVEVVKDTMPEPIYHTMDWARTMLTAPGRVQVTMPPPAWEPPTSPFYEEDGDDD
jgi:hypothetical protein